MSLPLPATVVRGRRAEALAADFLVRRGYRILELNYRIRQGEIDIVAEDGAALCFVEVRSRRDTQHGHPLESIDFRKRSRLLRAAEHYLMARNCAERSVRFDVLAIVYEPVLSFDLVQNAFEASGR